MNILEHTRLLNHVPLDSPSVPLSELLLDVLLELVSSQLLFISWLVKEAVMMMKKELIKPEHQQGKFQISLEHLIT